LAKAADARAEEEHPAIIHGNGECVLLVDDEADILRAMQGLLKKLNTGRSSPKTGPRP